MSKVRVAIIGVGVEEFIAAPGAPAPGDNGAVPTRARGDEVGVEDVYRPTLLARRLAAHLLHVERRQGGQRPRG